MGGCETSESEFHGMILQMHLKHHSSTFVQTKGFSVLAILMSDEGFVLDNQGKALNPATPVCELVHRQERSVYGSLSEEDS